MTRSTRFSLARRGVLRRDFAIASSLGGVAFITRIQIG